MAAPRKFTPETLRRAVNRYFRSITRTVKVTELVPTGASDDKGHPIYEAKPITNMLGKEIEVTEYAVPPCVADLCEALGIHRSTWDNYCDAIMHPELHEITESARERMKAWNEKELLTRPGKDIKGILFNLQTNYGYGGEKNEIELGPGAQRAMAGASLAEKMEMLQRLANEFDDDETGDAD